MHSKNAAMARFLFPKKIFRAPVFKSKQPSLGVFDTLDRSENSS